MIRVGTPVSNEVGVYFTASIVSLLITTPGTASKLSYNALSEMFWIN